MNTKQKGWISFLMLEAVVLLALSLVGIAYPVWSSGLLAFPFEQLSGGLRWLSLSGAVGNGIAVILYLAISLMPMVIFLVRGKKGKNRGEDGLLILLTVLLFFALYYMVNPGLMPTPANLGGAVLFGGAIYALLFSYAVLRALRHFTHAGREALQGGLAILLRVLAVVFVYGAFGTCFQDFLGATESLRQGNQGNEGALTISFGFLILRWVAAALPYVLDAVVALAAADMLDLRREELHSQAVVRSAQKLSRLCAGSLAAVVLTTLAVDLLQLLFLSALYTLHMAVVLPVVSVAFVLGALLLAQLMGENRELKEDNDLFI